jgi:phasin
MAKDTTPEFEIPAEMRALAEQSVEQARLAFDKFISAAHDAVNTFEGRAKTARVGAKDVNEKAMAYAEENVNNAFAFAQKLLRAKDVGDLVQLQADFIKRQMETLSEQAKELGEAATTHVMGAGKHDSSK